MMGRLEKQAIGRKYIRIQLLGLYLRWHGHTGQLRLLPCNIIPWLESDFVDFFFMVRNNVLPSLLSERV